MIDKINIDELTDNHTKSKHVLSSVLSYVSQNIDRDLSIPMICDKFGISKSTLWNLMKNYTGLSMKEFILNMRISRATELLLTDISVTEVSNLCGFNSYAHFIRTFTKTIGIPPHQYKKNILSKQ